MSIVEWYRSFTAGDPSGIWRHPDEIDREYREDVRNRYCASWSLILTKLGIVIEHRPKASGRIYILCLHHTEKTPSMLFWPDGGYFCFGCHTRGDVAAFVLRHLQGADDRAAVTKEEIDAFLASCLPPSPDQIEFSFL